MAPPLTTGLCPTGSGAPWSTNSHVGRRDVDRYTVGTAADEAAAELRVQVIAAVDPSESRSQVGASPSVARRLP